MSLTAFKNAWEADKISFVFDFIGAVFTIAGSLLLSLTAKDPNMLVVLPLYEVGALAGLVVTYRKKLPWGFTVTAYFVVINVVGFLVVIG